jgi:nucleoside-triphosphatase THEP1
VGRLELVTPATAQAVEKILAAHDVIALQKYNRFLEPILEEMKAANPAHARQIEKDLDLTYRAPLVQPQTPK